MPDGAATLDVFGAFAPYHGDDRYREVVDRAAGHAAIRMHGPADHAQVPALLASLDVLVVPSAWEENSPFVILEAFRAGVPVVASRIGGIPELVEHEVNGLLVEPGNVEALAGALSRLASDRPLLARLGQGIRPVRPIDDAVQEMRERPRSAGRAGGGLARPAGTRERTRSVSGGSSARVRNRRRAPRCAAAGVSHPIRRRRRAALRHAGRNRAGGASPACGRGAARSRHRGRQRRGRGNARPRHRRPAGRADSNRRESRVSRQA